MFDSPLTSLRKIVAACAVAPLAACTTLPHYSAPSVEVPAHYATQSAGSGWAVAAGRRSCGEGSSGIHTIASFATFFIESSVVVGIARILGDADVGEAVHREPVLPRRFDLDIRQG